MSLIIQDQKFFKLEGLEDVSTALREFAFRVNEEIGPIFKRLTSSGGGYIHARSDVAYTSNPRFRDSLPVLELSVYPVNLNWSSDEPDHGSTEFGFGWMDFRPEWFEFYQSISRTYGNFLEEVARQHTGERYTITDARTQWGDEEKSAFARKDLISFPQLKDFLSSERF